MYTFELEYNNEKIPLLFGFWMCGQLTKEGFDLNNFNPSLYENPYLLAPFVFYLAACNAKNFRRDDYEEVEFLKYCEIVENRESIKKGLNIFYRSVFGDVFMDEVEKITNAPKTEEVQEAVKKKVTKKKTQ